MEKSLLLNFALDILLPLSCISCKTEGFLICPVCKSALTENHYFICPVCGRRDVHGRLDLTCRKKTGLTRFLGAPFRYENEKVRKIIHTFKYQRVKALAEPLGEILAEFLDGNNFPPITPTDDSPLKSQKYLPKILSPIPMNNFKERERGFNQATEIGRKIAAHYGITFEERLLKKIKNTSNQADVKNREARTKNMKGAFACVDRECARSKIIILVDDVYTTGATLKECALVMRAAGAREIWGMTLAR